jgi:biotin operon repressor
MLLRRAVLEKIARGDVDLVFRRWKRPTVKAGGTLRTYLGMVRIESVEVVDIESITGEDAGRAGVDLAELRSMLAAKTEGEIFRVRLGGIEADPRVTLREDDALDDDAVAGLVARLDRLDRTSKRGPWTRETLRLLAEHPHVRAQDLADVLGLERDVFKNDVRKLKELGLTISHSPGYELSPRGRALLDQLDA